jgi:hypothetical protein
MARPIAAATDPDLEAAMIDDAELLATKDGNMTAPPTLPIVPTEAAATLEDDG